MYPAALGVTGRRFVLQQMVVACRPGHRPSALASVFLTCPFGVVCGASYQRVRWLACLVRHPRFFVFFVFARRFVCGAALYWVQFIGTWVPVLNGGCGCWPLGGLTCSSRSGASVGLYLLLAAAAKRYRRIWSPTLGNPSALAYRRPQRAKRPQTRRACLQ